MSSLEFMWNLGELDMLIEIIELSIILLFTNYTFVRIANVNKLTLKKHILIISSSCSISVFIKIIQLRVDEYLSMILLIMLITLINIINFRYKTLYSALITMLSISINYILYSFSIMLTFFPVSIFNIKNDCITLILIIIIYLFLLNKLYKIKKIKNGIIYLQEKLKDNFFSILILNICITILFLIVLLQNYEILKTSKIGITFIAISIIMFFTIKQSFDLYYKQNLLTKDLEQTKVELEEKKQEISKLEKENLEFSKTSHSLAHKQKSLEFKLEKLMKTGVDDKSKEAIKQEIQNISKEIYKEPQQIELPKTEIESIDDMFSYMQSECIKDNIKFELQVVGNLFYMINHLISENELEILLADHIKDAIIAINHSDNENRSILVRIGKIDNVYSLYIYDSGVEFEKEVLENLGKKPITTHADSGGTGMGFMNTFDTLNRTKASLIINEIGKPCIDNYTKVLIFKFDNKNEFIVNSYKNEVVVV
ncbi:MAG: hypothetical protein IJK18_09590 [Clostridia bacterium]|nr:hypothetical protein [Clostridia bacterium]